MSRILKTILSTNFIYTNIRIVCLLVMIVFINNQPLTSQVINNQELVLNIIQNKCLQCHNNVGNGTINFTNTKNIITNAQLIKYVVAKRIMPPWRADTSLNCFLNDRRLSIEEIQTIQNWVPIQSSEKNQKTIIRDYSNNLDKLQKPDLIIKLPKPFKIDGINKDIFVTYVLNSNIKETKYISAIAIKPTNNKELHHARVEIDSSDFFNSKINEEQYFITSEIEMDSNLSFIKSKPIAIYLPGLYYNKFPKSSAYPLTPKDKIILHLHYAPTTIEQEDRSEVWLYFSDDPSPNEVVFKNGSMTDFSVLIPADSITTISFQSNPLKEDLSIFAAQLHMHLLGKSINLKVVTPNNDTILLLNIPKWDFNWQEYYYYKELVKIPKGSTFITTSEFDNTNDNPNNPNIPPKIVNFYGMDTKNEMMGFICLGFYNKGDTSTSKIILTNDY